MSPKKNSLPPPVLSEALSHLAAVDLPLQSRELVAFSDLDTPQVQQFAVAWAGIDAGRRRQLLLRLVEISENNVEYNFSAIYRHALADQDAEVRQLAITSLWEDEEPSLIRPLLRLMTQDSSALVREAAAAALGRFTVLAECQKINPEYRGRLSQPLLGVTQNPGEDINVRRRALEAVASLSLAEVTQAIWAAYRQEDNRLKASAIFAMGKNCDALWLPTVTKEMDNEDPELRYEAVVAAGELGAREAVPYLVELIGDADAEVRLGAIQALGKIGGSEAKRALTACLTSKSQASRDAAEQALSESSLFEEPFSARGLGL